MTKPIRSFPERDRLSVARRRAASSQDGLGKISALNYLERAKKSAETLKETDENKENQEQAG